MLTDQPNIDFLNQAKLSVVTKQGGSVLPQPGLGPVWERGQRKRAAYKQNAAPSSLFAILRPHVETSAYSATCGSQTRVQRRPFGGLILCFWLKRIAYAETNMPLVRLGKDDSLSQDYGL